MSSQDRTEPPSATGRGANQLLVTLALCGNLRHAMQQETYAFLEIKTPELSQGLEEVNVEHRSTM